VTCDLILWYTFMLMCLFNGTPGCWVSWVKCICHQCTIDLFYMSICTRCIWIEHWKLEYWYKKRFFITIYCLDWIVKSISQTITNQFLDFIWGKMLFINLFGDGWNIFEIKRKYFPFVYIYIYIYIERERERERERAQISDIINKCVCVQTRI